MQAQSDAICSSVGCKYYFGTKVLNIFYDSYDVAPCELFFARFKADDINPRHLATSKTHFDTVVRLVLDRCTQIPKTHIILFFHHCMQNVFRDLVFEKL